MELNFVVIVFGKEK